MKNKFIVLSTGLALFSMFFGSGNLVFPLSVGQNSGGHFLLAAIGICLTGVLVPFLGAFAMMLFQGKSERFFGLIGKPAIFWFPLLALSLMGPFGVAARCLTVAHGSFRLIFPELSLSLFSLAACAVIFLAIVKKNRIVPLLGTYLTPLLLLSLAIIGIVSYQLSPNPEVEPGRAWHALKNGFFEGYQTMDLLAAFFFSSFVIKHLNEKMCERPLRVFLQSALIGASLLTIVYAVLVYLGATYAPLLEDIPPEALLGNVAQASLGTLAAPLVCVAVTLACLTTAIVLVSLFADFLKKEIARDKIANATAIAITLAITFAVSTLEFAGIAGFLGPILQTIYPALIVFTLMSIASETWGLKKRRWPVAMTLLAKLLFAP